MNSTNTVPVTPLPDPDGLNNDRAGWAEESIRTFEQTTGVDREDALCDLLCDLAHWADRNNTSFAYELSRAIIHYDAETEDEGQQFKPIYIE